nr:uncharacterized protein LOC111983702 [Quercus suber]
MTPIASYLKDDVLPDDKEATRKLKVQAARFTLIKDILYKRGFSRPYMRCLIPEEADYVMREVHEKLGFKNHYLSPAHPQANEQVEVMNRSLLKIIKTQLKGAKGIWPDKVPNVLRAYRMTARMPIGETPFQLAYRSEVVILTEVGLTSYRVGNHNEGKNDEAMRLQLDLVDEVRIAAELRLTQYQNLMANH